MVRNRVLHDGTLNSSSDCFQKRSMPHIRQEREMWNRVERFFPGIRYLKYKTFVKNYNILAKRRDVEFCLPQVLLSSF